MSQGRTQDDFCLHRTLGDERGCLSCNMSAPGESEGEHQAALQENTRKMLVYIILKAIDTSRPTYVLLIFVLWLQELIHRVLIHNPTYENRVCCIDPEWCYYIMF